MIPYLIASTVSGLTILAGHRMISYEQKTRAKALTSSSSKFRPNQQYFYHHVLKPNEELKISRCEELKSQTSYDIETLIFSVLSSEVKSNVVSERVTCKLDNITVPDYAQFKFGPIGVKNEFKYEGRDRNLIAKIHGCFIESNYPIRVTEKIVQHAYLLVKTDDSKATLLAASNKVNYILDKQVFPDSTILIISICIFVVILCFLLARGGNNTHH